MRVYPQKFYLRQKPLWINSMGKWSSAGGGNAEKTRQEEFEIAGEAFFSGGVYGAERVLGKRRARKLKINFPFA